MPDKKNNEDIGLLPKEIKNYNPDMGLCDHWCQKCDAHSVDPERPTTGKFFNAFGSLWRAPVNGYRSLGDVVQIVWAVCSDCLAKENS